MSDDDETVTFTISKDMVEGLEYAYGERVDDVDRMGRTKPNLELSTSELIVQLLKEGYSPEIRRYHQFRK